MRKGILFVVTAPSGIFNNEYLDIYVQDSSGGVNVFDWDLITLDVGDSVMVSGGVDWYKGKTEISSATVTVLGTGTVPVFIKYLPRYMDAWTMNMYRYGVAALLYLPFPCPHGIF